MTDQERITQLESDVLALQTQIAGINTVPLSEVEPESLREEAETIIEWQEETVEE